MLNFVKLNVVAPLLGVTIFHQLQKGLIFMTRTNLNQSNKRPDFSVPTV
jgi:hypothetical protein